ncbi:ABC transporter ATP-binding protein [Actinocorallia lasiicapitis]
MTVIIQAEGLERTYQSPAGPVPALREASFEVESGELVAVIGPSGSGKSTLMNLLGLLDRPTGGRLLLGGVDTGRMTERERTRFRAKSIGFVFQAFHLVSHKTTTANVMLPLMYTRTPRARRRRIAEDALRRVGLGHRLDALPATLSGGEKQRVAVARASVHHPVLLLADEPTGNLDTVTSATVMASLRALALEGLAVIVVTHDPAVAAACDHILGVRDGALAEVPNALA